MYQPEEYQKIKLEILTQSLSVGLNASLKNQIAKIKQKNQVGNHWLPTMVQYQNWDYLCFQ